MVVGWQGTQAIITKEKQLEEWTEKQMSPNMAMGAGGRGRVQRWWISLSTGVTSELGVLKDKGWTGGGESGKAFYSEGTGMCWNVEARMCKQYIRNFNQYILYTLGTTKKWERWDKAELMWASCMCLNCHMVWSPRRAGQHLDLCPSTPGHQWESTGMSPFVTYTGTKRELRYK